LKDRISAYMDRLVTEAVPRAWMRLLRWSPLALALGLLLFLAVYTARLVIHWLR
jgi:hypothetical protein